MKLRLLSLMLLLLLFQPSSPGIACSQMCNDCQNENLSNEYCAQCYQYNTIPISTPCTCQSGYSFNATSISCYRCDATCLTCSGSGVNQCLTCRTGFTFNTTSYMCIPPNNATMVTQEWSYVYFGFRKLSLWTFSNGAAVTTSVCDSKTLLGGYSSTSGTVTLSRSYSNLPFHYKLRVVTAFYFLSYTNTPYNAIITVDTLTPQTFLSPTSSMPWPYSNGPTNTSYAAINIDATFDHQTSGATISISSDGGSSDFWGIRQYVMIITLCNAATCETCTGTAATNCKTCSDHNRTAVAGVCKCTGDYYQDTTNSVCVFPCPSVPTKYYGDSTTRNCVKRVGTTPACPVGYFANDDNLLCEVGCPTVRAVNSDMVFMDVTNRVCATVCPTTEPYGNPDDYTCYSQCPTDRYRSDIDKRCVANCLNPAQTPGAAYTLWAYSATQDGVNGTCVAKCPANFYAVTSTAKCSTSCPTATPQFFKDNSTGSNRCIQTCPAPDYYGDTSAGICTQTCPASTYGDPSHANRWCMGTCSSGFGYVYGTKRLCVAACPEGTWALTSSSTCVTTQADCGSLFADNKTRACVVALGCSFGYYASTDSHACELYCPASTYGNPDTKKCETSCVHPYFADNGVNLCVTSCITQGTYADIDSSRTCVPTCNTAGSTPYSDNSTRTCVSDCNQTISTYVADEYTGGAWVCSYWCTTGYYADRSTTNPKCVQICPPNYFSDNSTGTGLCVAVCPIVPTLFGDTAQDNQCVELCTGGTFGDQRTTGGLRKCIPTCPPTYFAETSNNRCVKKCDDGHFGYNLECLTSATLCPTDHFGDNSTNLCVNPCPADLGTFGDPNQTNKCVNKCPNVSGDLFFADPTNRQCVRTCSLANNLFGNNNTQTCVATCQDLNSYSDDQSTYRVCVSRCSTLPKFYYANNQTKKCVENKDCPANYFGENTTQECVAYCPPGTYAYAVVGERVCIDICPSPTYGDNSTGHGVCVTRCPTVPMLWADTNLRVCVNPCPATGDWYGEDVDRECTQLCPPNTFAYEPTRRCLSSCPTGYFGDDTASVRRCWPAFTSCTYGYGDGYLNLCVPICTGPTPVNLFGYSQQCVSFCPPNFYADSYSSSRLCVHPCPGVGTAAPNLYGDPTTRACVARCQTVNTWADYQTRLCQSPCSASPDSTFAENITYTCVVAMSCPTTPSMTYGEVHFRTCTPSCRLTPSIEYSDPTTRMCVGQCPNATSKYYGDTSTGSPRCVQICPQVPRLFGDNATNLCVAQCLTPLYGDQKNNRTCVGTCPIVLTVMYFSQNHQRICVAVCKDETWGNTHNQHCEELPTDCAVNDEYADNSTHLCVGLCPESMNYFADPSTRFCVPVCPGTVEADYSYADYSTRKCVPACPANYGLHGTFGNNDSNICEAYCTVNGTYGDPQTSNRYCVTECSQSPSQSFADPSTRLCVPVCPSKPSLFGQTTTYTCVSSCTGLTYADHTTRQCKATCPPSMFKRTDPNLCVEICPSNPDLYGDANGFCVATCTGGEFANSLTRLCVASCLTASGLFQYNGRCTKFCPVGFYADGNGDCVTKDNCQASTFAQNSTTSCVGTCVNGFADPNSRYCIAVCPTDWYGDTNGMVCTQSCSNSQTASNISNMCVSTCTNNTYKTSTGVCSPTCPTGFADSSSWSCVPSCPTGVYNTYGDTVNKICVLVCPTGYYRDPSGVCLADCNPLLADPITGNCEAQCSVGYWGYNYVCGATCPGGFYGYLVDRNCYSNATIPVTNLFGDSFSKLWVATCPINPLTFGDRTQLLCVSTCPSTSSPITAQFADPTTRQCQTACQNTSYFADPSTFKCVITCPANQSFFGDPNDFTCKLACTGNLFADNSTRRCVSDCPAETNTFGYVIDWTCVKSCPTGWYAYNETQRCTQNCPVPYYADADEKACVMTCDTGFAEPTSRTCVASCATSASYPLADNSTRMCVSGCPSNPNYFASNNLCVLTCPAGQYAQTTGRICVVRCEANTYGDPVSGDCIADCLPGYFADDSTNLCVTQCPSSVPSFSDNATRKCVGLTACASGTFSDPLTSRCTNICTGTNIAHINQCIPQCPTGFYADPLTKACVGTCPAFGYSYAQTTTMTCVRNCSGFGFADNSTRSCVASCPSLPIPGTYSDPFTFTCVKVCPIAHSLFMQNSTQQCLTGCLTGYADLTTRFCVLQCFMDPELYADVPNKKCVASCPGTTFADNSTNLCVSTCPTSPNYFADPLTKSCVLWCSQGYYSETTLRTCATGCTGTTFADNKTRSCVGTCPVGEQTFADPTTNRCVRVCPVGYWADNGTQECVNHCPTGWWEDNVTKYCVSRCPSHPLAFGLSPDNACVNQCPIAGDLYGDFITQTCQAACAADANGKLRFADSTTRTCVYVCPVNQSLYGDSFDAANTRCVGTCSNNQYRDSSTQRCVVTCPSDPDYYGSPSFDCVRTCPPTYFASDPVDRLCLQSCSAYSTFADPTTSRCVSTCSSKPFLYADSSTWTCVPTCPGSPDLYGSNKTQSCVSGCPADWNTFADPTSRTCVTTCPSGSFAQNSSRRCVTGCPGGEYADPITKICVALCSVNPPYYRETNNLECVTECPTNAFKHDVDHTCVYQAAGKSGCPTDYYADTITKKCVKFCPLGYFAEDSTALCVTGCTSPEFADNTTRKCVTTCSNQPTLYADPTNQKCVLTCQTGYYTDNITRSCVTGCSSGLYADDRTFSCSTRCKQPYYADLTARTCIPSCIPGQFAQDSNRSCVTSCTSPYFGDTISKLCVLVCPPSYFSDTHTQKCQSTCTSATEYRDNSTRSCVSECPRQPFLFADGSTKDCVTQCPLADNTFGDLVENVCVGTCPDGTFAEVTTRTCVTHCPENTFADTVTKGCQGSCQTGFYASNITRECVVQCPNLPVKTYGVVGTLKCETSCPAGSYAENISRMCVTACPADLSSGYADLISRACVTLCPIGSFALDSTASCVSQCPINLNLYANPTSRRCQPSCPALQNLFADPSTWTCVYTCPSGSYADTTTNQCIPNCNTTPNAYSFGVNNSCVEECPTPYFAYVVDRVCVTDCGDGFFGSLIDHKCYACLPECPRCRSLDNCTNCTVGLYLSFGSCVTDCMFTDIVFNYKDSTTMNCVDAIRCPTGTYGLNSTKTCQPACPAQLYPNDTTKRCQSCPTTCSLCTNSTLCSACIVDAVLASDNMCYAYCDPTNKYFFEQSCYAACPNGTYLSLDLVTCQMCSLTCLTCFGSATNCTVCAGTYKFNESCVNSCPTGYYGSVTGLCEVCDEAVESCRMPVTFNVTKTVENYKNVIILKFNQEVKFSSNNLSSILKIRLKMSRRMMADVTLADMINSGIPFTYQILPDGTVKIVLDLDTTLTNPVFQVVFTSPSAVQSLSGSTLQSISNLITVASVQVYPAGTTTDAPTNIAGTILSLAMVCVFFASLIFTPMASLMSLTAFQMFHLHCYINYTLPPNLFFFLQNLHYSMLTFLPNLPGMGFTDTPFWQQQIPQKILDVDGFINWSRSVGAVVLYIIVYFVLALIVKSLTTKCNMNRSLRNLVQEVYDNRVKFGFMNEVLWVWCLPVLFYSMVQMLQFKSTTPMYSFNLFLSVLFFLAFIALPFIFVHKIYKQEEKEVLEDNYKYLTTGLKQTLPQRLNTFVYYLRNILFVAFLVGPLTTSPKAQILLLVFLNLSMLIYLIVTRPHQQCFTNFMHIMHQIGLTGIQIGLAVYLFNMQNSMTKSRILYGLVLIALICVHLTIALIYAMFRVVIGYQGVKQVFLASEFYKLYIDDSYEVEMEKEIEETLAKVNEKEEGTIDDISVANSESEGVIKLRIKRRRKITSRSSSGKNSMFKFQEEPEYERINPDPAESPEKPKPTKSPKKKHNIFDKDTPIEQQPDKGYQKMDNKFINEITPEKAQPIQVLLKKKEGEKTNRLVVNEERMKSLQSEGMDLLDIEDVKPQEIKNKEEMKKVVVDEKKKKEPEVPLLKEVQPREVKKVEEEVPKAEETIPIAQETNEPLKPQQAKQEVVHDPPAAEQMHQVEFSQQQAPELPNNDLWQDMQSVHQQPQPLNKSQSPQPQIIGFDDPFGQPLPSQQPSKDLVPQLAPLPIIKHPSAAAMDQWTQLIKQDPNPKPQPQLQLQLQLPPKSPEKPIETKRQSVFQFDDVDLLLDDNALNAYVENEEKREKENKLKNALFEEQM